MKNLYSCVSFFWKVGLVLVFILPSNGIRGLQKDVSVTCLSLLKISVKKNIFSNIFMGQEYSDSRWLYRLSMRILESDPLCPLTLTLIALGFLRQHIIYARLFMDERVASPIFQKFSFKVES